MVRKARKSQTGEWFHVYSRGARRHDVFIDDFDRMSFLWLLQEASKKFDFEVHVYCLMGNHYHLLIRATTEELSRAMHRMLTLYVMQFNARHGFDGSLFKERFGSRPIEDEADFKSLIRYILYNPVKDGFTDSALSYPWSSAGYYLGEQRPPLWHPTTQIRAIVRDDASFGAMLLTSPSATEMLDIDMDIGWADSVAG